LIPHRIFDRVDIRQAADPQFPAASRLVGILIPREGPMTARKRIQPKRARRVRRAAAKRSQAQPTPEGAAEEGPVFAEPAPIEPPPAVPVEEPAEPPKREEHSEVCGEPDESRTDAEDLN
jgi:hypothetical protein